MLFAHQPGLFEMAEGNDHRERLKKMLENRRTQLKQDPEARMLFLWLLVRLCPPFLKQPEGYEWVAEEWHP